MCILFPYFLEEERIAAAVVEVSDWEELDRMRKLFTEV
jgi:hypothetical protein